MKKTTIKGVLWVMVFCVLITMFLNWSANQEARVLKVSYCWDSDGNHYLAPNVACR